jgi:hypothetical protein
VGGFLISDTQSAKRWFFSILYNIYLRFVVILCTNYKKMSDKGASLKGGWTSSHIHIDVNLSMIIFEEDGSHIVYCPALDVSGYGISEDEAMKSFTQCLSEFFHYTTNKKTFHTELTRMGWKIKKSKIQKMTPPLMVDLLQSNENFSRIFNNHPFRKIDQPVAIPSC